MKKNKKKLFDLVLLIFIPFVLAMCDIGFQLLSFKSWFLYIVLVAIINLIIRFIQLHKK